VDDTLLRNYLLGTLNEADRQHVEDSLRRGNMNTAQLSIVEDELIDDYLSGQMDAEDRKHFEKYFVQNPTRAEKLKFGKLLHSFVVRTSQHGQPKRNRAADLKDSDVSSPSTPNRQATDIRPRLLWLSKTAITAGVVSILVFGIFAVMRIQTLRNQIESLERKEEQLRIRIGKIEKNLNVDNEDSGSTFRNSSNSADGFVTIPDGNDQYTIVRWEERTP